MPEGYGEYEVDIAALIRSALPAYFDELTAVPLVPENIMQIPAQAQGAYLLLLNGTIVYIGKTDSQAGFRSRLIRHFHNIQHRKRLDPAQVSLKAVRVFVFNMFDLETILIEEYTRTANLRPIWNTSGFGSNDPGHRRETQDPAIFDVRHPIDIDREITAVEPGCHEILTVLLHLKSTLPYLLRFEHDGAKKSDWRYGHADMRDRRVRIPIGSQTARSIVQSCLNVMGNDWQATVMPNRLILYKETVSYPSQIEAFRGLT